MFMRATKRAGEAPKSKTLRENEACFHFLVETIATPILISRGERLHYVKSRRGGPHRLHAKRTLINEFLGSYPP